MRKVSFIVSTWAIGAVPLLLVGLWMTLAKGDEARTNRVLENPVSDGDLILRINDGGVKTSVLTVKGSTSHVLINTATDNAALNVSGGISLGDEALSNYDEGTFTPAVASTGGGSATYTTQAGHYTRIGRTVFYHIAIQFDKSTLGAGDVSITGLPFTAAAAIIAGGAVHITELIGYTPTTDSAITLDNKSVVAASTTTILLRWLLTSGVEKNFTVAAFGASGNQIRIAGHYTI